MMLKYHVYTIQMDAFLYSSCLLLYDHCIIFCVASPKKACIAVLAIHVFLSLFFLPLPSYHGANLQDLDYSCGGQCTRVVIVQILLYHYNSQVCVNYFFS
jgi:hypothetical protein